MLRKSVAFRDLYYIQGLSPDPLLLLRYATSASTNFSNLSFGGCPQDDSGFFRARVPGRTRGLF